jgi:hypothetical protein
MTQHPDASRIVQVSVDVTAMVQRDRLNLHVHKLAGQGWRMDVRDATSATLSRPVLWLPLRTHLLLALCTFGLWGIPAAWMRQARRRRQALLVTVDDRGEILERRVPV